MNTILRFVLLTSTIYQVSNGKLLIGIHVRTPDALSNIDNSLTPFGIWLECRLDVAILLARKSDFESPFFGQFSYWDFYQFGVRYYRRLLIGL